MFRTGELTDIITSLCSVIYALRSLVNKLFNPIDLIGCGGDINQSDSVGLCTHASYFFSSKAVVVKSNKYLSNYNLEHRFAKTSVYAFLLVTY